MLFVFLFREGRRRRNWQRRLVDALCRRVIFGGGGAELVGDWWQRDVLATVVLRCFSARGAVGVASLIHLVYGP